MVNFSKKHNSVKIQVELRFFLSAHGLMMLYIYTKFHDKIFNRFRDVEQTPNFIFELRPLCVTLPFTGHMKYDFCTSSRQGQFLTRIQNKLLRGYEDMERTRKANARTDGQMDRQTDGCIFLPSFVKFSQMVWELLCGQEFYYKIYKGA